MIRKNTLPDTWADGWLPSSASPTHIDVSSEAPLRLLLTDEEWLLPLLGSDIRPLADLEHLELNLLPGSSLEIYRLQALSSPDRQHQTLARIFMQQDSSLRMCTLTLGGSHVRNNVEIRMQGEHCSVEANGLYLLDRMQQADNYIFVEHAAPHCSSHELYKGIIDDSASARFNGHVLVQDGAVGTEAHQTNRNILLTDKAHVDTRPFLEIYNDDVKCSHGSTIGQLDEQALFYLRTRGISTRTAVTMLSYAFCDEVISSIPYAPLREVATDMVKKRLHGELETACDECAIRCSSPCNGEEAHFNIDPSRL